MNEGSDDKDAYGVTPLLSVDDLAGLLGIPRATIHAWRYKGTGPKALRIGRHVKFRPQDVQAWLREREAPS